MNTNDSIFVKELKTITSYQKKNDNAKTTPADLESMKDARRRFSYQYNAGYYNRGKYEILLLMLDTIEAEAAEVIEINAEVRQLQKEIRKAQKTA